MRRGSSNMWWIIIGAVLALVVMIVLMVMFTGKSGAVETGLLDCQSKGGQCGLSSTQCRTAGGTPSTTFTCPAEEVCCFGLGSGNVEQG